MSAVERMSPEDLQIIKECLDAAVNGPFFPDWEFPTLMGFTREEIAAIAVAWPFSSEPDEQKSAVNNVLNMLLGYPHDRASRWHEYLDASPERIARVLARWRGDDDFDETARGVFDRLR
ncbi:hypothetical protein ACFY19_09315 [Streptosporangium saharense]|uniref:hypothetical protein n=1 Tax=Streptosporangium saharense TaxID=1706840 RepID=UPI0036C62AA7